MATPEAAATLPTPARHAILRFSIRVCADDDRGLLFIDSCLGRRWRSNLAQRAGAVRAG
ncbi:hypothetical protein IU450_31390 [Nocardia abscessus]|uniref:hypothetical protein n=1 Tax=Nocardia abscessus TaxID=120957 RepID=UPI001894F90A|nr:hypothetical protein [Nocardia abscessus]MBF6340364.1 hypothetical protein [Nocardia abscessus]